MTTVLKFAFDIQDQLELSIPRGARLLHVGVMKARPCLWALVEENSPAVPRRFRLTATGEPIHDHQPHWRFVGTMVLGAQDCHLWDLGEPGGES